MSSQEDEKGQVNIPGMPAPKPKYMIYGIASGGVISYLAAQQLVYDEDAHTISVKDLAAPMPNENGVGFHFKAVAMTDHPVLHMSALLLEEEMPLELVPAFQQHQRIREEERRTRPPR